MWLFAPGGDAVMTEQVRGHGGLSKPVNINKLRDPDNRGTVLTGWGIGSSTTSAD